jgi:hypothetical protein
MKHTTLLFLFFANFSFTQLINVSVEKNKSNDKDTGSSVYLEAGIFSVSRTLEANSNFLNKPLGERANETKINLWSYSIGMVAPISKYFVFDGGLSFVQNGEQYSWQSSSNDSTFNYQTKYRYIGMPLQLKFHTGKNVVFFFEGGLLPQMQVGYLQTQNWTDSLGGKEEARIENYNNLNSFVLSAIGSAGIVLNFQNNLGFRLSVQYRHQLTDSYSKFNGYLHKSSAIGVTFGLTRKIE